MADNQRSWWQQWTDTTYIKPLNRLVGGPCLAVLPKLGIPGVRWGMRGLDWVWRGMGYPDGPPPHPCRELLKSPTGERSKCSSTAETSPAER